MKPAAATSAARDAAREKQASGPGRNAHRRKLSSQQGPRGLRRWSGPLSPRGRDPRGRDGSPRVSGRATVQAPGPAEPSAPRRATVAPPGPAQPKAPRRATFPPPGRTQPNAPRRRGHPGGRSNSHAAGSIATGATAFVRSLFDHPLLDRIVRGRAWIPLLGVLLAGVVATQVEILKLGASIGRSLERSSALASRNEQLREAVAALADDQRIERLAAGMGMVMPPPGAIGFLSAQGGASLTRAASSIHAPNASAFLTIPSSNGAVVTGNQTSTASPASTTPAAPATIAPASSASTSPAATAAGLVPSTSTQGSAGG